MGRSLPFACTVFLSASVLLVAVPKRLSAQHVTTATIEGRVRGQQQEDVDGVLVRVVNGATGYVTQTATQRGRFAVPGLQIGGPYSVVVQRLGYRAEQRDSIFLTIGQQLRLDFALLPLALALDTLVIVAAQPPAVSPAGMGIGTMISDSALHRLPTINRDLYDFLRFTPQVAAASGGSGLSAGGVSNRFNNFLLDGVSERGLLGNFAAGTGQGAKQISIEAVKEYQVLLSPYDPRYGDFAGALVNAVTKNGTNQLHGTAFGYYRNEDLARGTPFLRDSPYQRAQFGFAIGGPIVRDRAHFFVAPEVQRLSQPAPGPYVGQSANSSAPLPVSPADVARFADTLRGYGLEPGSAGRVTVGNPLVNFFGRIDVAWPERSSRLVVWNNYSRVDNILFSRGTPTSWTSSLTRGAGLVFPLSSARYTSTVFKEVAAAQLYTYLRRGGLNEFLIGFKAQPSRLTPDERAPAISVAVARADTAGAVYLEAGSHEAAHGISTGQTSLEIADNLTLALGSHHRAGFGARAEFFEVLGVGLPATYGAWLFSSLDALERGEASRYRLVKQFDPRPPRRGLHYSAYAGDEWRATDRLALMFGLRADIVSLWGRAPYNATVDSLFGRATSDVPPAKVHWSPRIGFSWNMTDDGRSRLQGGAGVFVGRPPIPWLNGSFRNYGSGVGTLECGGPRGLGPAPQFVPDYQQQPEACATGGGLSTNPAGLVNFGDKDLRLAETFRTSLAYHRSLPWGMIATLEGLYTRNLSDFVFVNLDLAGPIGLDPHGRALYGTVNPAGIASPVTISNRRFSEVIELRNQSENYSFQLAGRLEKRFSHRLEATASYAYSQVRDVQTPPSFFNFLENWRTGRVMSGLHEEISAGISALDIPHHVVLAGTYRAPWRRWVADLSFYYVGVSGSPFTYLAWGAGTRGDLNADGTNLNDPIYIPRDASDPSEILFDSTAAQVAAQQAALEGFIENTPCLRRQRGQIMARNSCRAPWVNLTNASLRVTLPPVGGRTLSAQLDVVNLLNLLNPNWGRTQVVSPGPNAPLLEQVAQDLSTSQPVFRFDPGKARFDDQNLESAYQLQLALRYTF